MWGCQTPVPKQEHPCLPAAVASSSRHQPVRRGGGPTSSPQLASVLLGPGHQLLLQMFFPGLESPGAFTYMSWLQSHRPVLASQRRGRLRCAGCSGLHRRLSIALPRPAVPWLPGHPSEPWRGPAAPHQLVMRFPQERAVRSFILGPFPTDFSECLLCMWYCAKCLT